MSNSQEISANLPGFAFVQATQHYYATGTVSRQYMEEIANLESRQGGADGNAVPHVFQALKTDWLQSRDRFDSGLEYLAHPSYQAIISLGRRVIPLILRELEAGADLWFPALAAIAGVDPVKEEHRGNTRKMQQDWLEWGRELVAR